MRIDIGQEIRYVCCYRIGLPGKEQQWQAMKNIEEISIPELARKLDLSAESTALAAGWLARENKICIKQKNGVIKLFNENYYAFRY